MMSKTIKYIIGVLISLDVLYHILISIWGIYNGTWLGWAVTITSIVVAYIFHKKYKQSKLHHSKFHKDCNNG